jgi:hypothetical protein
MGMSHVRLAVVFTVLLLSIGSCGVGAAGVAEAAAAGHAPVTVNGNAGFAGCGCVTSGNGTPSSPYVVGPYQIGSASSAGYAVLVENVTASFEITGISIGYNDLVSSDPVIWLANDNPGPSSPPNEISAISANNDGIGVRIDNSSNVSLDNLSINKMNGTGLYIDGSSNISLSNSKLKATTDRQLASTHGADGLYVLDSTNINIGGVSGCPHNQLCNSFDYDSGWGIYLQNTTNTVVDEASGNADDTGGFVLDNSSGVTIENSEAEAGGPICVTVGGSKLPTGYAQDSTDLQGGLFLINGSHDDSILNDSFSANLGNSISSGGNTLGGAAAYFNPCTNAFEDTTSPPSPTEAGMGAGNVFNGTCYDKTNIATLPPNRCK